MLLPSSFAPSSTALMLTLVVIAMASSSIHASDEGTSAAGRIVEFTVANLDPSNENDNDASNKFRIQLHPEWAPIGVERFEELTDANFWDDMRIFRIVPNFVSQFGISSYPKVQTEWETKGPIVDDPVVSTNSRGTVSFATAGENTRTTQIFINTGNGNARLDGMGFAPIGEVLVPASSSGGYGGMDVVDRFYAGYRELPDQGSIKAMGLEYLDAEYPMLSYFVGAGFVDNDANTDAAAAGNENPPTTTQTTATKEQDTAAVEQKQQDTTFEPKNKQQLPSDSYGSSDANSYGVDSTLIVMAATMFIWVS